MKITKIRYAVTIYIYGAPFPHFREFQKKRDAVAFFDYARAVPEFHDVELIDYSKLNADSNQ